MRKQLELLCHLTLWNIRIFPIIVVRLVFPLLFHLLLRHLHAYLYVYEAQNGVFRLRQAEDSLLSPFWQEVCRNCTSLAEEGVYKFIWHCEETGSITCVPGSSQIAKKTTETVGIFKEQMEKDDETMGKELQKLLAKNDINIALAAALR